MKNRLTIHSASLYFACSTLLFSACGGENEQVIGQFTSQVVQRNTCKVSGDTPESCLREDSTSRVRVTLLEDGFDRAWLAGVEVGGLPSGRILGTRDINGDFLFYDEVVQTNTESGCTLTQDSIFSLAIDPAAEAALIGTDPCIALIGREERITTSSAECDDINDPSVQIQRIIRRRWETPVLCTPELTD
ncbi:MAG: hypothetical protein GY822_05915 [Deltaproteobacteria bacterium]|nr:hypothetical protein [Deltaproteobacteria bacterium]